MKSLSKRNSSSEICKSLRKGEADLGSGAALVGAWPAGAVVVVLAAKGLCVVAGAGWAGLVNLEKGEPDVVCGCVCERREVLTNCILFCKMLTEN